LKIKNLKQVGKTTIAIGILLLILNIIPNTAAQTLNTDAFMDTFTLSNQPVEGQSTRLYASAKNSPETDTYGNIIFSLDGAAITAPQPISIVNGQSDQAFIDWTPSFGGYVDLTATLYSINIFDPDESNNTITLSDIFVDYDTDGDGIGNLIDIDDDNDNCTDEQEESGGSNPLDVNDNACQTAEETQSGTGGSSGGNTTDDTSQTAGDSSTTTGTSDSDSNSDSDSASDSDSDSDSGSDSDSNSNSNTEPSTNQSSEPSSGGGSNSGNNTEQNSNSQPQPITTASGGGGSSAGNPNNNLGADNNNNAIPDFMEIQSNNTEPDTQDFSFFDNRAPQVQGFRVENEPPSSETRKYNLQNQFIQKKQSVLGFKITPNDIDGDGITNQKDKAPKDPLPILKLKTKNLGLKRFAFDAGESTDNEEITQYKLIISETQQIESKTPHINHKFEKTGLYDIVFTIEDTAGQKAMERLTINVTYLSASLLIKLLILLLIIYFGYKYKKSSS
jgi:hypothetical protein